MALSTKIPSPAELGLPAKFDRYRSGQEEAIRMMVDSPERVVSLCQPTGAGKSLVVIVAAILSKEPTCIVTSTRSLQDQYMNDFAGVGLVDLRGRSNYECQMKHGYTCEDGYSAMCPYRGTVACSCSQAEMRAATSSLVITNYDKWTSAKKYGQGMQHFKRVVFDEAHNAPQAIARAMQVTLNSQEIEDGLKCPFPRGSKADEMYEWRLWASAARVMAEQAMQIALARITGVVDVKKSWVKHYTHMRNLVRRLAIIATARVNEWVVEQVDQGYQFDPIRLGRYGEAALLLRMPKVIMLSATLRPKTLFMCGIGAKDFMFEEFASDFDPARCPIYYVPTMRVDSRAGDLGLLWAKLDQIIAKRRDRKGVIHTVSYARRDEIAQRSRFFESMIVNPKGEPPTETIEYFRAQGPGAILVSPSVGEGQDFAGDDCRWQFLAKIPFEPPSKIVKAREADDKEYRGYQSMQKMVQAFGRGMRSRDDYCENFIGDEHLSWFLPKYAHLAPKSFHGFFKRVEVLPRPLKL